MAIQRSKGTHTGARAKKSPDGKGNPLFWRKVNAKRAKGMSNASAINKAAKGMSKQDAVKELEDGMKGTPPKRKKK